MSYNPNDMSSAFKHPNLQIRKSRQLLPKISRAFPKDFFREEEKKDLDKDYEFEISMKFTSNKPPREEIENFLYQFQNYLSTKELHSVGEINMDEDNSVIIQSSRILDKPHSRNMVPQNKLKEIANTKAVQGREMLGPYQGCPLPQMTFGDYSDEQKSAKLKNRKGFEYQIHEKSIDHYDENNKENIVPLQSNRNGRVLSEPVEPITPIFKPSTFKRAQILREIRSRELDMQPIISSNPIIKGPQSHREIPPTIFQGGRKALNLAKLEIMRNSRSHESARLNQTAQFKPGFLPSISKEREVGLH